MVGGFHKRNSWNHSLLYQLFSPGAAATALELHPDPRVEKAVNDPTIKGIMDVYVQLATVLAAVFTLLVMALVYIATGAPVAVYCLSWFTVSGALALIMWMWMLKGVRTVPLDLYVQTHDRILPPWGSWLTKARLFMAMFAVFFAIIVAINA